MAGATLYTYPENFRAYKGLVAAKYSGKSDLKTATNFVFGETNLSAEFKKKFPGGIIPALETSDGLLINDCNAIAYYLANDKLRGSNLGETALILQWMNYSEQELLKAAVPWLFQVAGILPNNKETFNKSVEDTKQVLDVLDKYLATRTYFVGEDVTLADIAIACSMLQLYANVLDAELRKQYAHVTRWFCTIVNQPNFVAVVGPAKLCGNAAQLDCKKPQQSGKAKENKKESAKKESKKAPAPKKEKEPAEEMDLADEALAAEPKQKDPFETLPKGTFVMDDFKRCYSNEDETKSIPYFWEKFDPENYSIWFGEYKYNEELDKVFMSCNLITGMFQRLDKMRKQAFASVCLFGEDKNSSISGVWVWRGQELVFTLSSDWQVDYEVYNWKKLNPASEETKKLVQQYFSWTGTDKEGRKFNQGKIFK